MEKFIPYEKLSKKEKRKLDLAKRQTWGELNPVTRKPANSKAYNRKRTQDWKKELPDLRPNLLFYSFAISFAFRSANSCSVKIPASSNCFAFVISSMIFDAETGSSFSAGVA